MWGCPALHYQEHPEVENERSAGYCGQYPPALEGHDNSLCHRPIMVNLPARLTALMWLGFYGAVFGQADNM